MSHHTVRTAFMMLAPLALASNILSAQEQIGIVVGHTTAAFHEYLDPWPPHSALSTSGTRGDKTYGITLRHPLSRRITLAPELRYVTNGQDEEGATDDGMTLGYIELPLVLRLARKAEARFSPTLSAGLAPAILVHCRWVPRGESFRDCGSPSDTPNPWETPFDAPRLDLRAVYGVGVELRTRRAVGSFELRLTQGLRDLETSRANFFRQNWSTALLFTLVSRSDMHQ